MKCWICGGEATTKEHRIKASDLRYFFGEFSQKSPIYFHTDKRRNKPVGSAKADVLKSQAKLCNTCNSALTQPYDKAWEKLSVYLQKNLPRARRSRKLDLTKVFPGATARSLLDVHLYFLKVFGCLIVEHDVPIEIGPFSDALLKGVAHPDVYLALGPTMGRFKHKFAGMMPIETIAENGVIVFAFWYYIVGDVTVDIIYARNPNLLRIVRDYWHPKRTTKTLRVSNFKHDFAFHREVRRHIEQEA